MTRAIITGATGAVGTALVKELVAHEIEVLVFCREGSKRNKQILEHPLVTKMYCSLDSLSTQNNYTKKEYDVFYHFAWEGTTGAARNDMYIQNANVRYALDAVGVAKRFGCKKFIGAGSQAEYGRCAGKLKPDTPVSPETGYGYAKLCAGQMTREYAHQMGLEHNWVRILSVYGPNDNSKSMVMSTINILRKGKIPQFTKGEQLWDYLFSNDAARAFMLLGDKGIDGKTYILGNGNARPLSEYIKIIRDIVSPGQKLTFGTIPYSEKQVMHLCADISEIEKDAGWRAETKFVNGIKITLETL